LARILAISSQVARGHVGLSAIVPALQRLGHEVLPLPTIILSNHPGHPHVAGTRIAVDTLRQMIEALAKNGWLASIDVVLTGYLPSREHVDCAAEAVALVREHSPAARFVCDPVMGDDPKGLYIAQDAAEAIRDRLVPLADVTTPNRFELSWLSGRTVTETASSLRAAAALAPGAVVATSIPDGANLANVLALAEQSVCCRVLRRSGVPHGTGDLLSGLLAGRMAQGRALPDALSLAVGGLERAVARSAGADDLRLAIPGGDDDWSAAPPARIELL
jgi:pyridoxine kinase